jgi:hypothetical protein
MSRVSTIVCVELETNNITIFKNIAPLNFIINIPESLNLKFLGHWNLKGLSMYVA